MEIPFKKKKLTRNKPRTFDTDAFKALVKQGLKQNKIAKVLSISEGTVSLYIKQLALEAKECQRIRAYDKEALILLSFKAKERINHLLDTGQLNARDCIKLLGVTFEQLRLIEGKSSSNIEVLTRIIQTASDRDNPVPTFKPVEALKDGEKHE